MSLIQTNQELEIICQSIANEPFIAVDTEFNREHTYYAQLCLIQVAAPNRTFFAVDPLAPDMDLSPLFALFDNPKMVKVFHASRQDIEIILRQHGKIPSPLFDTQIAAMVCGFGEAASYGSLVEKYLKIDVDKSHRFTNWAKRPLSDHQLEYALDDVRHLCGMYPQIKDELERNHRYSWVEEEMIALQDPQKYQVDMEEVWRKIRMRSHAKGFTNRLRVLAVWREIQAQKQDIPRGHFLRDLVLLELAAAAPITLVELAEIRGIPETLMQSELADDLLKELAVVAAIPADELPQLIEKKASSGYIKPVLEMLRLLLRQQCNFFQVAEKLVATEDDLFHLASQDSPNLPAMQGWRYEIFGSLVEKLKKGEIAFTLKDGQVTIIATP